MGHDTLRDPQHHSMQVLRDRGEEIESWASIQDLPRALVCACKLVIGVTVLLVAVTLCPSAITLTEATETAVSSLNQRSVNDKPQYPPATEYVIKAGCLLNLSRYVAWPEPVFESAEDPIRICVLGEDPFGSLLDITLAGRTSQGRPVAAHRYSDPAHARSCHVLFISRSEAQRLDYVMPQISQWPILTVSDIPNFLHHDGIILLYIVGDRIKFAGNWELSQQIGLKVSSRIIALSVYEYREEIAFLYELSRDVVWPESVFKSAEDPIRICVLGKDPFGSLLDKTLAGRTSSCGRSFSVHRPRNPAHARSCHILYVSKSEDGRLDNIMIQLSQQPILTISDIPNFHEYGGLIHFFESGKNIRFSVSVDTATQAGLEISPRLLDLATIVIGTQPLAAGEQK